ncbi:AAA family ATPase [Mesorhizobium sp. RCC_202]|uniref:nSTAND1 domain-containing NTPase n=1 Tax=Mesorhizobium sp. RCC_202 TaxID=3239222 RepID=UPI00352579D0
MAAAGVFVLSNDQPFPGLRPFGPLDRPFFFGRDAQISALYRLLNLSRFVAVIGNSGSGKSSLVRAGLLPLLAEETDQSGSPLWPWVGMRPAGMPLQALTRALLRLSEKLSTTDDPAIAATRAELIAYHLRASSYGVAKAVGEMDQTEGKSIVLLVDQFEEIFRFASAGAASGLAPEGEARQRDEAAHFVQLLLEASRSPTTRIHIILTMRSDFIGDCARFQGLPEAVSAAQFLVPSLTRDQRSEVITRPVAAAGATIEASLVEQLLNDSGDEQNQLPVLQHCLLRLWERTRAPHSDESAPDTQPSVGHIALVDYEQVHGMAGALSQHADEILSKELPGMEPLVARVFRALSELDRDGRATRRVLSFRQLEAETAIDGDTLRGILDRFRADDCSFLTPSPAETATLEPETRIDVGHEALLRHWERVSGVQGATGERGDARPIGWLREEYRDGQRYRALLAIASDDDTKHALLSSDQVDRYWNWWNESPRPAAWAKRHGGGHERVEQFLEDSRTAAERLKQKQKEEEKSRRRGRLATIAAIGMGTLLVFMGVGAVVISQQKEQARQNAMVALLQSLGKAARSVRDSLNRGDISVTGAKDVIAWSEAIMNEVPDGKQEVDSVKSDILSVNSDISVVIGDYYEAFNQANSANKLAMRLVNFYPQRNDWQLLSYNSLFRLADARLSIKINPENISLSLADYRAAQTVAEKLVAATPEQGDRLFELAFIHNKIGETLQYQKDIKGALAQFRTALEIAKKSAAVDTRNITWQAYVPSTVIKMANALTYESPPDMDGAIATYSEAISMQEDLLKQAPNNNVVQSNLANGHRAKGDVLVTRWSQRRDPHDLDDAMKEFSAAISMLEELSEEDRENATWLTNLGPSYSHLGSAYEKAKDFPSALAQFQKELTVRQKLAKKDPTNERWQKNLENARRKVDQLTKQVASQPQPSPQP